MQMVLQIVSERFDTKSQLWRHDSRCGLISGRCFQTFICKKTNKIWSVEVGKAN